MKNSSFSSSSEGRGLFRKEKKAKRTLTYEILNLFARKLITPGLYHNYELTLRQFDDSLDFFERKISNSIYKVTRQINIDEVDIPSEVEEKLRYQYDYCIEGGELFLDAIDEMRFYLDHVSSNGDSRHTQECDWEPREHLEEGLEIAMEADEKITKSLNIYNELYSEGY